MLAPCGFPLKVLRVQNQALIFVEEPHGLAFYRKLSGFNGQVLTKTGQNNSLSFVIQCRL